jgi:hypothetical protein
LIVGHVCGVFALSISRNALSSSQRVSNSFFILFSRKKYSEPYTGRS